MKINSIILDIKQFFCLIFEGYLTVIEVTLH